MSWIRTQTKPVKLCVERPEFEATDIFHGHHWEQSGGTKQICVLMSSLILAWNIDTVVEIGVWNGFASFILAKSLYANSGDKGTLISIDVSERNLQRASDLVKDVNIKHECFTGDSLDLNMLDVLQDRKVGLAFIDGNHSYECAKNDIEKCWPRILTWGFLVAHDYSRSGFPGVYRAVNEHVANYRAPLFFLDENRETNDYRSAVIQKTGVY